MRSFFVIVNFYKITQFNYEKSAKPIKKTKFKIENSFYLLPYKFIFNCINVVIVRAIDFILSKLPPGSKVSIASKKYDIQIVKSTILKFTKVFF